MKILFLDVDGVLNCVSYFATRTTPRDGRPRDIDPFRAALIHRILDATGAKVVVSSAWRLADASLAEVRAAVEPHYIDKTPLITSFARYVDRGEEIAAWLAEHSDVEAYAIIDDDADAGVGHGDNFFRTEWNGDGLNEEIVARVIAHLNA